MCFFREKYVPPNPSYCNRGMVGDGKLEFSTRKLAKLCTMSIISFCHYAILAECHLNFRVRTTQAPEIHCPIMPRLRCQNVTKIRSTNRCPSLIRWWNVPPPVLQDVRLGFCHHASGKPKRGQVGFFTFEFSHIETLPRNFSELHNVGTEAFAFQTTRQRVRQISAINTEITFRCRNLLLVWTMSFIQ